MIGVNKNVMESVSATQIIAVRMMRNGAILQTVVLRKENVALPGDKPIVKLQGNARHIVAIKDKHGVKIPKHVSDQLTNAVQVGNHIVSGQTLALSQLSVANIVRTNMKFSVISNINVLMSASVVILEKLLASV